MTSKLHHFCLWKALLSTMSNLLHRMLLTLRRSRPAASRLGTIVARSFKIEAIVILMLLDTDGQKIGISSKTNRWEQMQSYHLWRPFWKCRFKVRQGGYSRPCIFICSTHDSSQRKGWISISKRNKIKKLQKHQHH